MQSLIRRLLHLTTEQKLPIPLVPNSKEPQGKAPPPVFGHVENISDTYNRFEDKSTIQLISMELSPGLFLYAGTEFDGHINTSPCLRFGFVLRADGEDWPIAGYPPGYDPSVFSEEEQEQQTEISNRYPIGPELVWLADDKRRFVARPLPNLTFPDLPLSVFDDHWRFLSFVDAQSLFTATRIETCIDDEIILLDQSQIEALRDALWRIGHDDKRERIPYDDEDFEDDDDDSVPTEPSPKEDFVASS